MTELRSCGTFQYKQTKIDQNKPDLILLEKKKICYIAYVAYPFDTQRRRKRIRQKLSDLKYEISKMWKNEVIKVYIVLVVIGALGMVSKNITRYLEIIGFDGL